MAPLLSRLEILVLLALARVDEGYAVAVQAAIVDATKSDVSMAAVYLAMTRLEQRGYTRTSQSEPRPERGGRSRRKHELTAAGRAVLQHERDVMSQMWRGVSLDTGARKR